MNAFSFKKILLIIAIILAIFALAFLIYSLFFSPPEEPGGDIYAPTSTAPGTGGLPDSDQGQRQPVDNDGDSGMPSTGDRPSDEAPSAPVSSDPSLGLAPGPDGQEARYYNIRDGKFYRIDRYGEIGELSDKVFHNVDNVVWSNSREKAVLEYPDGFNVIYDFKTGKQVTLPQHWKDFDFSPNDDKLVYKSIGMDPGNRWLAVANSDGSQVRPIELIGENEKSVYPAWSPNNQIVAMHTKGIGFDRQEVYFIGTNEENFKSIVIEGRGFQPKWSNDGEKLLYSVYSSRDNMKPSLWTVNASGPNIGTERKNLQINTWAEKCTYGSGSKIFCAVPRDLPDGAGLIPELAANTEDTLYQIDTATGLKKELRVPGKFNISNIVVSENEQVLYFTDTRTQTIYKIDLIN